MFICVKKKIFGFDIVVLLVVKNVTIFYCHQNFRLVSTVIKAPKEARYWLLVEMKFLSNLDSYYGIFFYMSGERFGEHR